jgi:hypothetical protein
MAAAPTAGVLAGGGSAMVHALVQHRPAPSAPPPALASIVDPVQDADGTVRDWRMNLPRLLSQRAESVHDLRHEFVKWRSAFVTESLIGDMATVRAFLQWADHVTDVSALKVIGLGHARIDQKVAPRVAWQAHEAAVACRARGELGLGVMSPMRTGVVRGFVVSDGPVLVLADAHASVTATAAGFEVRDGDAEPLSANGWVVEPDGVTVINDDGQVALRNSLGGRLLAQVAPGVSKAAAAPVPHTSIFSGLLMNLPEMALLAARGRTSLLISTGG